MHFLQQIRAYVHRSRAKTLRNWACTQLRRQQYEKAVLNFTRAIQHQTCPCMYGNRGYARYKLGDVEGALEDYAQAIAMKPRYVEVYINRGMALFSLGQLDDALSDLNLAIYYAPKHAVAYNNRALVSEAMGNLPAAISDYTMAIQVDPANTIAYSNRGRARVDVGDFYGALRDLKQYLQLGGGLRYGDQQAIEREIAELQGRLRQTA